MSKGQWQLNPLRWLRLRFVGGLLRLLLELSGPWRHDAIYTCVGDGLTEVLAKVPGDRDEGAAESSRAVEHFLRFVRVGLVESDDGVTEMYKRIFQSLQNFWLISRESRDGLRVEAWWKRGAESLATP